MVRWVRRGRWWACVLGTTTAVGLAFGQGGMDAPPGLPKVGDTITLKFGDGQDRQFKVLKVERQPDGTYLSDVKDVKTGETITLLDRPAGAVPPMPTPPAQRPVARPAELPPLSTTPAPLPSSPAMPPYVSPGFGQERPLVVIKPVPEPDPAPAKADSNKPEPPKKTFLNRLGFGNSPDKPAPPPAKPQADADADGSKRQGLIGRLFGPKKPPAPPVTASGPAPAAEPPLTAADPGPPPVRPTPSTFPVPAPMGSTIEPPRVAPGPMRPSTPPPAGPQSAAPAPIAPGLVSTPIVPSDSVRMDGGVVRTQFTRVPDGLAEEVVPYVRTLRSAHAPSERITAVQALANCRHASSEGVKSVLFGACIADPCPLVRATCIDELCNLGYFNAAFLAYLADACSDPSDQVRASAKTALRKMTPQR
jgi:hypothetical protein